MKIIFTLSALFLFMIAPSFAGVKEAGNGGGISEKLIMLAYANIREPLEHFIALHPDNILPADIAMVQLLIQSDSAEKANVQQIQFKSGLDNPEFFLIDGEVRVGRTGNDIGDTIYINTDLLYTHQNDTIITVPIDYATATSILVHELIHHHGVHDQTTLDRIGTEVAQVEAQPDIDVRIALENVQYLEASYVNYFNGSSMFQRFTITSRTEVLPIENLVPQSVCKSSEKLSSSYLSNLSWSNQNHGSDHQMLLMKAHITCGPDAQSDVILGLLLPDDLSTLKSSPAISVLDCQQHPETCW